MPKAKPPIRQPPKPLVRRKRKLIVLWSPKSACTMTYVWFANVCGLLDEVRAYHEFPHRHRVEVFHKSTRYRRVLKEDLSGYQVVKIIRDPYQRAVSIFRHAFNQPFADDDLAKWSGGSADFEIGGVTFQQFLNLLLTLDMKTCNTHYRPQIHPYEAERKPDVVINISRQDLFAELNALAERMGWPQTDFTASWLHQLPTSYRKQEASKGPVSDRTPIHRGMKFPSYDALLTPQARGKIEEIYHADFEAYGQHLGSSATAVVRRKPHLRRSVRRASALAGTRA